MRKMEALGKLTSFFQIAFAQDNQDKISYFFLIRTVELALTANRTQMNEDVINLCICCSHLETSNAPEIKVVTGFRKSTGRKEQKTNSYLKFHCSLDDWISMQ